MTGEKDKRILSKDKRILSKDKRILSKDKRILSKDKRLLSKDKASMATNVTTKPKNYHSPSRYEEQMTFSTPGSENSDTDPIKDAQETAEDAAILKRFKIVNLVGTGNYARVYRAFSHSGRELAIKAINLKKTSENYRTKFLPRELTILRKISHVNICKIHEILHISDRVFIVMQFCQRGTIADLLHKYGPISETVARFLFVPVVDAISYLHSQDLAHRDLKVENILLDCDYTPKLTDFSYSVSTAEHRRPSRKSGFFKSSVIRLSDTAPKTHIRLNETFCGTLPYLSPEMIKQSPYDPKKTDIWSLGICLYVMLNDRLPFPFNDIRLMVKKQMTKDFKFRTGIEFSEPCKDLISQMLEPDFYKRIGSAGVVDHRWMCGPRDRPQY